MPGLISVEPPRLDAVALDVNTKAMELSTLHGPPLDVPVPVVIDMLKNSFEKYHGKLAVASMFQPANYLASIFEKDILDASTDASRDYLRWSYGQVRHAGELLAVALAERGVQERSTIAVLHYGSIDFYICFYATMVLRCRFAPMNYHSITNADEIQSMLKVVGAKVICATDDKSMHTIFDHVPEIASRETIKVVIESPTREGQANGLTGAYEYLEDLILDASAKGTKSSLDRFDAIQTSPDDDAVVIFTR